MSRVFALTAAALAGVVMPAATVSAQRPTFGPTIFWDAGLINTPAAYVPPLGGDLTLSFSRTSLDPLKTPRLSTAPAAYNFSVSGSAWGRAELGVSVFGSDLKNGLFVKALVWDQTDGIWRSGLVHWLPSFAVGVRNLGLEHKLNRLSRVDTSSVLNTSPTLYLVATRTFVLSSGVDEVHPKAQLSLNAGLGSGLFFDDGNQGKAYANSSSGGAFGGAQLQFTTGRFSTFSLLAEHDAWDVNVGAQVEHQGLRASAYVTELGAGAGQPGSLAYRKISFAVGWQTNLSALVRGNLMEQRKDQYEQEADALRQQIVASERRITDMQTRLRALQMATAQEQMGEREALERKLREEQEALRRLQELLRRRQEQKK